MTSPKVFLVGCPRSGTTMLRLMLDAHPSLAIPPESHFIPLVARVRSRYDGAVGFDSERMARDVVKTLRFKDWQLPPEAVFAEIERSRPRDLAAAIEAFFVAYARAHGKPRWGDKTPGYSIEMPLIASFFPDARFVHLVRDGRNVALSLMEVPRSPRSFAEAAQVWATRIRVARRDARELDGRVLEIRYEDLVDDPETGLKQICGHVDIEWDPAMLEYHRGDPAIAVPQRNWGHHRNLEKPPTSGLRDWRSSMTHGDQELFEAIAGEELTALGYERRFPDATGAARMRAAANIAYDGLRHRARTLRIRAAMLRDREALPPPRRW